MIHQPSGKCSVTIGCPVASLCISSQLFSTCLSIYNPMNPVHYAPFSTANAICSLYWHTTLPWLYAKCSDALTCLQCNAMRSMLLTWPASCGWTMRGCPLSVLAGCPILQYLRCLFSLLLFLLFLSSFLLSKAFLVSFLELFPLEVSLFFFFSFLLNSCTGCNWFTLLSLFLYLNTLIIFIAPYRRAVLSVEFILSCFFYSGYF